MAVGLDIVDDAHIEVGRRLNCQIVVRVGPSGARREGEVRDIHPAGVVDIRRPDPRRILDSDLRRRGLHAVVKHDRPQAANSLRPHALDLARISLRRIQMGKPVIYGGGVAYPAFGKCPRER